MRISHLERHIMVFAIGDADEQISAVESIDKYLFEATRARDGPRKFDDCVVSAETGDDIFDCPLQYLNSWEFAPYNHE